MCLLCAIALHLCIPPLPQGEGDAGEGGQRPLHHETIEQKQDYVRSPVQHVVPFLCDLVEAAKQVPIACNKLVACVLREKAS